MANGGHISLCRIQVIKPGDVFLKDGFMYLMTNRQNTLAGCKTVVKILDGTLSSMLVGDTCRPVDAIVHAKKKRF